MPLGLVVLKAGAERDPRELRDELVALVRERIGPVACFRDARVVARLPKTRSGKILRGTMRDIAAGRAYTPPATIDDPAIIDEIAGVLGEPGLRSTDYDRGVAASALPGAPGAARAVVRGSRRRRGHRGARLRRRRRRRPRVRARRRRTAASPCACPTGICSPRRSSCPGSAPLYENEQRVGHWVLLPEDVQDDRAALREWLRHAHALTAGRV